MTAAEIRLRARTALRVNRGWGVAIGGWATWIGVEFVASRLSGGVVSGLFAASLVMAAQARAWDRVLWILMSAFGLSLLFFYFFHFAKVFGTTLLAVATLRGEPRYGQAFAGFGYAWRTIGVHLWIGWRVLPAALPWLLPIFALGAWMMLDPWRAGAVLREDVLPVLAAHPLLCAALAAAAAVACASTVAAWYHYRLTYNVFVDHPDWTGAAVVDEARRLATGRRGVLFRLDLWFLGICFAAVLPGVCMLGAGLVGQWPALSDFLLKTQSSVSPVGVVDQADVARLLGPLLENDDFRRAMFRIVFGLGFIWLARLFVTLWVQPYWTAAHAAFYETVLDLDEAGKVPADAPDGPADAA